MAAMMTGPGHGHGLGRGRWSEVEVEVVHSGPQIAATDIVIRRGPSLNACVTKKGVKLWTLTKLCWAV